VSAVSVPQLAAWEEPLSLARMRLLPRSPSAHAINARRHDVSERAVSMRDASKPRVKVAKCPTARQQHALTLRGTATLAPRRRDAQQSVATRRHGGARGAHHPAPAAERGVGLRLRCAPSSGWAERGTLRRLQQRRTTRSHTLYPAQTAPGKPKHQHDMPAAELCCVVSPRRA
jgi:hypothetical protein